MMVILQRLAKLPCTFASLLFLIGTSPLSLFRDAFILCAAKCVSVSRERATNVTHRPRACIVVTDTIPGIDNGIGLHKTPTISPTRREDANRQHEISQAAGGVVLCDFNCADLGGFRAGGRAHGQRGAKGEAEGQRGSPSTVDAQGEKKRARFG